MTTHFDQFLQITFTSLAIVYNAPFPMHPSSKFWMWCRELRPQALPHHLLHFADGFVGATGAAFISFAISGKPAPPAFSHGMAGITIALAIKILPELASVTVFLPIAALYFLMLFLKAGLRYLLSSQSRFYSSPPHQTAPNLL